MLSLSQVLTDFDIAHLRAIARQRAIPLSTNVHDEIVDTLTDALRNPDAIVQGWTGLSSAERGALAALQRAGGRLRAHLFFHRFGALRRFGPGRLEREQPWKAPAGAAEGLWYKGFIGRSFALEEGETVEFVFIPKDIAPSLPAPTPEVAAVLDAEDQSPALVPAVIQAQGEDLLEDLFQLLLFVQLEHPRTVDLEHFSARDLQRLSQRLRRPEILQDSEESGVPEGASAAEQPEPDRAPRPSARLQFLYALGNQLGLFEAGSGRLRLTSEVARSWLSQTTSRQHYSLWEAWAHSATWNDLAHVPGIRCEPARCANDPAQTRARFLRHVSPLSAGTWHSLGAWITHIRGQDPDFQRPDGDYQSWYIADAHSGQLLRGFEQWDQVEGALLQYYLCGPLHWLGAVDLGFQADGDGAPDWFRIAEAGQRFLAQEEEAGGEHAEAEAAGGAAPPFELCDDLTIRLAGSATLYHRFQAERFAEAVAGAYQITSRSLWTARLQGLRLPAIQSFLEKASGAGMSTTVQDELQRRWDSLNRLRGRRVVILEFSEPALLAWLQGDGRSRALLGEIVSPTTIHVPERLLPRLLDRLRALGLDPQVVSDTSP